MRLLYVILLMSIWAEMVFAQNCSSNENYEWEDDEKMSSEEKNTLLMQKQLEEELVRSGKITLESIDLKNFNIEPVSTNRMFESSAACVACKTAFGAFIALLKFGTPPEKLKQRLTEICTLIWKNYQNVCIGVMDMNFDIILYIIKQRPKLSATRICSIILQHKSCTDRNKEVWSVNLPESTSTFHYRKVVPKFNSKPMKILQITDLHYDPGYTIGSNAKCDDPICCQKISKPKTQKDAAGIWGDYRKCDTPWHAFEDAINHILAAHPDIDVVYFVGDIISHIVWATTVESNTETLRKVYGYLNQKFANIPIYYTLGNHEPHPVNVFAPIEIRQPDLSTNWLFELAVEQWNLPKDTRETILRGGYYTTLVKPGFRIVVLNSNVCYTFNWWLLYNDLDPYGQLLWLVQVLYQAERNEEIVHILSHVPSNDERCLRNWAEEYTKIIKRFSNIIAAQFNGHTHFDDFIAYFDEKYPYKQYSIAFNGGSLTTYDNLNPNYKIYYANPSNLEVLEAESWTYNITSANLNPNSKPNWYKLYSFTKEFGVSPSSGEGFLIRELIENESTFQKFFRFKHRDAHPSVVKGCDKDCRIKTVCYLVTPYFGFTDTCKYTELLFGKKSYFFP